MDMELRQILVIWICLNNNDISTEAFKHKANHISKSSVDYFQSPISNSSISQSSSHPSPTLKAVGAGPPVVNALDITDSTTSHHSMSRLSPASWMRLEKTASRPSMASLVHSTVKVGRILHIDGLLQEKRNSIANAL